MTSIIPSSLTMDEYQAHTKEHAVYPEAGEGTPMALSYVGLGLGEAGEVQGKIKKILRGDPQAQGYDYDMSILEEAGDVLWYIARLAEEFGTTLGEVAAMNLKKLDDRKQRGVLKGSGDKR